MSVTIKQIAKYVGVSPATVSRVLSGRGAHLISEATRQRVWQAAQELGYQPNLAARSLVTGRTGIVALWMHELFTSFHARVVQLVEDHLHQRGYDTLIRCVSRLPKAAWHGLGRVDGILAHEGATYLSDAWRPLQRRGVPLVSMGAYALAETDHVRIDLYRGATQAVQHLLEAGCRRIAYLVNAEARYVGEPRRDGYDRTLSAAGLTPEYIVATDQSRAASSLAVRCHMQERGLPDGIFCHNDEMAIGAYHGLRLRGVRIPDDVALVGCDGIEDTEYLDVPLTTIRQPLEEMCQLAVEFLKKRIAEPHAERQSALLQPVLVIRASTQGR
ncbi:MAG: LacI family transcriptional regulator [bacterium]|nr:LacI family transcriptional regulator [bacterium]